MARGMTFAFGSTALVGGVLGCCAGMYTTAASLGTGTKIVAEMFRLGQEINRAPARHMDGMISQARKIREDNC